jgi:hypothetical protein
VFADWLDDRGDVRAPGYRALGNRRKVPEIRGGYVLWFAVKGHDLSNPHHVPIDWYMLTEPSQFRGYVRHDHDEFKRRSDAEDCVAWAFAALSPDRQTELLGVPT